MAGPDAPKGGKGVEVLINRIVESANRHETIENFRRELIGILGAQEYNAEELKGRLIDAYDDGRGEGFGNQNLQFAPGFIDAYEQGEISENHLKKMLFEEEPKENKKEESKENEKEEPKENKKEESKENKKEESKENEKEEPKENEKEEPKENKKEEPNENKKEEPNENKKEESNENKKEESKENEKEEPKGNEKEEPKENEKEEPKGNEEKNLPRYKRIFRRKKNEEQNNPVVEETPVAEEIQAVEKQKDEEPKKLGFENFKKWIKKHFGKGEKKDNPVVEDQEFTDKDLKMIDNILQEVSSLKSSGVRKYDLGEGVQIQINRYDAENGEYYDVQLMEDENGVTKVTPERFYSKEDLEQFLKNIVLKDKSAISPEEPMEEETPVVKGQGGFEAESNEEYSGGEIELKDEQGHLIGKGKYDGNNEKDGMWEEYLYDGNPTYEYKYEISYKHGKKDGPYKWYDKKGWLTEEGQYKDGSPIGERKHYNSNGMLGEYWNFDNGKCIENRKYDEDGILIEESILNPETGDVKTTYFISSSIRREKVQKPGEEEIKCTEYIDDKSVREGTWDDEYFYYDNFDKLRKENKEKERKRTRPLSRILRTIFPIRNSNQKDVDTGKSNEGEDQPVGEDVEEKDKKGHIIGKGKYNKNGRRSGPWKIYDHLGGTTYITEATYKDGIEDGPYRYFGNGEKVQEEGQYKNGIRIGKWTEYYYDSDDVFTYRTYNDKGTIISEEEYDRIGEISKEFTYDPLTEIKVETHYYLDGLIWKVTQKLNEDAEYQEIKNGEITHTGKYGDYYFNSENMENLKTQKLFENIAKFVVKNNKLNIGEISKKFHTSYNDTMEFVKKMESLKIIKKSTNEGEYEIVVDEENLKSIFVKSREDLNNEK